MGLKEFAAVIAACAMLIGCGARQGEVDDAALRAPDKRPGEWLAYGRDPGEQRYSPLTQVNAETVGKLGLAWTHDLGDREGLEATPLVVDGVMYVGLDYSEVLALDAKTGKRLWAYDPKTRYWRVHTCCGPANRGVAYYKGKVYVGALDGRLIALDAKTGKEVWSAQTFDKQHSYSITGAPRIAKGKVLIGNGGAEFGVRGYVTAYDAETGKLAWRFYTVPGKNPTDGAASDGAMKIARPTWNGEFWKLGGGGTAWDSIVYDPELDLVYIGVGNGSPWNAAVRSPGGGDNLFLSSIVAVRADTGEYAWHFQETPGESWDFTATQPIMLADLTIGGKPRKVLMHAPKNGFFYVLDRATGEFISGRPYAEVNWAKGLDAKGRPIENPDAHYDRTGKPFQALPFAGGAHSWHPMSFSPKTGLVYLSVQNVSMAHEVLPNETPSKLAYNTHTSRERAASRSTDPGAKVVPSKNLAYLLAWDPVRQREAWRAPLPKFFGGGTLATAGDLVFEGGPLGEFAAYRADTGHKLWTFDAQTGMVAPPITYEIDGEQYVAVAAGWGGAQAPTLPSASNGPTRILVFKLGAKEKLPPKPAYVLAPLNPPPLTDPEPVIARGAELYGRYCARCHADRAAGGGGGPAGPADLRRSGYIQAQADFDQVVLQGALKDVGMAAFGAEIDAAGARAIRAYILEQAHAAKGAESRAKPWRQGAPGGRSPPGAMDRDRSPAGLPRRGSGAWRPDRDSGGPGLAS